MPLGVVFYVQTLVILERRPFSMVFKAGHRMDCHGMQRALPGVLSVAEDPAPPPKVRPQEGGVPDSPSVLQGDAPRRVGARIGPAAPGAGGVPRP